MFKLKNVYLFNFVLFVCQIYTRVIIIFYGAMSSNLPRFISEKEIAERKLRNEAEGKKEEPYDPRPLYDRLQVSLCHVDLILQAERARKQEEYEASTAFKNQIHRLDEDEVAFLTSVDRERNIIQESVDQEAELLIKEAKISFWYMRFNRFQTIFICVCQYLVLNFYIRCKSVRFVKEFDSIVHF